VDLGSVFSGHFLEIGYEFGQVLRVSTLGSLLRERKSERLVASQVRGVAFSCSKCVTPADLKITCLQSALGTGNGCTGLERVHSFMHQRLYSPLLGPDRFFILSVVYTFIRTPWMGISTSQGRCLNTGQHKDRINTNRHPCLD
jgi:hypothetical protein